MDFGFDVFSPFAEWWARVFTKVYFPIFGIYVDVGGILVFCGICFLCIKVYRWLTDG